MRSEKLSDASTPGNTPSYGLEAWGSFQASPSRCLNAGWTELRENLKIKPSDLDFLPGTTLVLPGFILSRALDWRSHAGVDDPLYVGWLPQHIKEQEKETCSVHNAINRIMITGNIVRLLMEPAV